MKPIIFFTLLIFGLSINSSELNYTIVTDFHADYFKNYKFIIKTETNDTIFKVIKHPYSEIIFDFIQNDKYIKISEEPYVNRSINTRYVIDQYLMKNKTVKHLESESFSLHHKHQFKIDTVKDCLKFISNDTTIYFDFINWKF